MADGIRSAQYTSSENGTATGTRVLATPYLPLVILLTLLAFALRVYRLGHQSLWYDEGFSVWLAGKDLASITTGDFNPPLYVYLLHFWLGGAGTTEFAVRFLSLLFSVLAVPLTIRLGTRLFDRPTGLLGGLLVAVAPLHLWYAQETRMYAMVTALSLLACGALFEALQGRRACWPIYLGATVAAVYTHYYAWMVVAAQTVFVLWWLTRIWGGRLLRRAQRLGAVAGRQPWPGLPRPFRLWLLSQIALVLAVVPWLPILREHYRYQNLTYWPGTLSLQWVAERTFTAFSVGETLGGDLAHWATLAFLTLGLVGIVGTLVRDRRKVDGVVFTTLYVVVPVLLLYLIVHDRPKFAPRYLMIATPGFYLLAAAGLRALWPRRRDALLWRPLGALAVVGSLAFLLTTSARSAVNMYFDPTYAREDFRGLARYLEQHVGEDEGVLLLSGHFFPVFQYYYHRTNWLPLPTDTRPSPSVDEPITLAIAEEIDRFAVNRSGLWIVLWQDEVVDPNGVVLALLDRVGRPLPVERQFHGLELRHYRLPSDALFAVDIQRPLGITPIPQVRLVGYDLLTDPTPADTPVDVLLYWQALAPMDKNYKVSLRLLDDQGIVWAVRDGQLAGFWYPTYRWDTGEVVLGRHKIPLPPGIPPGRYELRAIFYDAEGSMNAVELSLGDIAVARPSRPPTVEALQIPHPFSAFFGGLELLGYDVAPLEAPPGAEITVTLFWRAHQGPGIQRRFQLRLGDSLIPLRLSYPIEQWRAGDVFQTRHRVRVPARNPGGVQPLQLVVLDADGQMVAPPAQLAEMTVTVADRRFEVPTDISHPERVELGTGVTFLGYDILTPVVKPGGTLRFRLYWRARAPMEISYKVFTHLLNVYQGQEQGMWGQLDRVPVHGTRPTTGWLPGEVLIDEYEMQVDPGAPPGEYYIEVGMYDWRTMQRLPAIAGGQRLPGDRVLLEGVRIEP